MIALILSIVLYFIIVKQSISLKLDLITQIMPHDYTLTTISNLYDNIPFKIPTLRLCFGTPNNQCFNLAISTTTLETMIETVYSEKKHFDHQYDANRSLTFQQHHSSMGFPLFDTKNYYLSGKTVSDRIGFPNEKKSISDNQFVFIAIEGYRTFYIKNIDGYIGLQRYYFILRPKTSFLSYLQTNNIIHSQTFTYNYNSNEHHTIEFGEDHSNYSSCYSGDKSFENSHWNCNITDITLGKYNIPITKDEIVVFDSVKSSIIASLESGKIILDHLIELSDGLCELIEQKKKYRMIMCDSELDVDSFPLLQIKLNETALNIDWKNLMKLTEIDGKMLYISLFISRIYNNNQWSIGLPGFIDHSIIFDRDKDLIGIEYLKKKNNVRLNNYNHHHYLLQVIYIQLICFLVLGIGLLMIVIKSFKRQH